MLSLQFDYDGDGVLLITEENYLRLKWRLTLTTGTASEMPIMKNRAILRQKRLSERRTPCERYWRNQGSLQAYRQGKLNALVGCRQQKIKISNKTNNGIDIMAKRIANVENLEQRLKDGDPSLVQELGGKVGERHAVSFASKFCTEVSLTAFGNTKFAKFDSVMRDVLPIYAYNYLGKTYWKKPQGAITCRRFRGQIQGVSGSCHGRCRCDKHSFPDVDIDKLDLMLWYYYKGKSNVLNEFVKTIQEKSYFN